MTSVTIINGVLQSNTSTDSFLDCHNSSVEAKALKVSAWSLIFLLSSIGNVLMITTVLKTRALHSNNSFFMVNMAISDLLVPLFVVPQQVMSEIAGYAWHVYGVFGACVCKIIHFAGEISIPVSILTMIVIAVERFHCVVFPLRPPLISAVRFRIIVAAIWLVSAVF